MDNNINYVYAVIIITVICIIIMCCLSLNIASIYTTYKLAYNTEVKVVTLPCATNIECPPLLAENDEKCKNNMNWLQQNWTPDMTLMKENTRCNAYKKAKAEGLCV